MATYALHHALVRRITEKTRAYSGVDLNRLTVTMIYIVIEAPTTEVPLCVNR